MPQPRGDNRGDPRVWFHPYKNPAKPSLPGIPSPQNNQSQNVRRQRATSSRFLEDDDPTALLQARLCLRLHQQLELEGKRLRRPNTAGASRRCRAVSDVKLTMGAVSDAEIDKFLRWETELCLPTSTANPAAYNMDKENTYGHCYMERPAYGAHMCTDGMRTNSTSTKPPRIRRKGPSILA
ncbi:hypothetical protein B0H10DRAFT_2441751 [Mycena sp. CBHHK59/15]|nr:hypothetical protein B0H10DRAFT_2441751 [Mycena sp. CBHHK59/15]